MLDILKQREQQREDLLRQFYERSGGYITEPCALEQLAGQLGWPRQLALDTYVYLRDEGYVTAPAHGTVLTIARITHKGIKKVEAMVSGRDPVPPTTNLMIFNNSQVGHVAQGNQNRIQQNTVTSPDDLAENLQKCLSEFGNLTEEAHQLIRLLASESEDRTAIISAVHSVCGQKPEWKQYLRDFVMPTVTGATGDLLAAAIQSFGTH